MFLKSRYQKNKTIPSNPGTIEKIDYIMKVDKNGHKYLVEGGRTNTQEIIRSHKDEVDINRIMDMVIRGDVSKLNFNALEMDLTTMPDNMQEFMNAKLLVEQIWGKLDKDIRAAYNNEPEQFLADWGSENFLKNIGYTKPEDIVIEKEVKNEQE